MEKLKDCLKWEIFLSKMENILREKKFLKKHFKLHKIRKEINKFLKPNADLLLLKLKIKYKNAIMIIRKKSVHSALIKSKIIENIISIN